MKLDNAAVMAALEDVRAHNSDGLLLPTEVVAAARDAASPLHSHFTWDDSLAARMRRLDEARNLIRVVVTMVGADRDPVRAYVSLPTERAHGGGYRSAQDVARDEHLRQQHLRALRTQARSLERQARRFEATFPLADAIASALDDD